MAQQGRVKQWNLRPYDDALSAPTNQWMDWVTQALNWLIAQGTPTSPGLPAVQQNIIDPTSSQLLSLGSRPQSITTAIAFVAGANNIAFYWDGTNGSSPLAIYRDDGSVVSGIRGNINITGLATTTKYFFYPYYNELNGQVQWATVPNVSVGTPPLAFAAINALALQQQYMRNHIPLSQALGTTGVTTGSGGGSGGGGGGGGGGGKGGTF